jgi:hypothetical protein
MVLFNGLLKSVKEIASPRQTSAGFADQFESGWGTIEFISFEVLSTHPLALVALNLTVKGPVLA